MSARIEQFSWPTYVTPLYRPQRQPAMRLIAPFIATVRSCSERSGRRLDPRKRYCVYSLRLNGSRHSPFYIGKGLLRRPTEHFREWSLRSRSHKDNTILQASKTGRRIFVEILYQDLSEEAALALEMFLIDHFGRRDLGTGCLTNKTNGGEGVSGLRHSAASKEKMRRANLGKILSPETRAKISSAHMGRTHTDAAKANMSRGQTGRQHSDATIAKLSEAAHGRVFSAETRAKISASNTGKRRSAVSKEKMAIRKRSTVTSILATINPTLRLLAPHVGGRSSLVQCLGCSAEVMMRNDVLKKGVMPRGHSNCPRA